MNLKGTCEMEFPGDRKPRTQPWLLFKVGSAERIEQMRKGLLYMNSLDFFSRLDGEEALSLRKDEQENVFSNLEAKSGEGFRSEIELAYGNGDERKSILLNQGASITLGIPRPSNTFLFCMGAIANDANGKIQREENGELSLNSRFVEFGDTTLLINSPSEFSKRVSAAIANDKGLFSSPFMEGCYGLVDYVDFQKFSGNIGVFRKDKSYEWQREFRMILGAENEALNPSGAYELNIGDISDICSVLDTKSLTDTSFKVKLRKFSKVGDGYEIVDG